MKKLSENPKTGLIIMYFILTIEGIVIMTYVIKNEFITPHDPNESLWVRSFFLALTLALISIALWGTISLSKQKKCLKKE